MVEDFDWYDHNMEELSKAMLKAKEAFEEHFEEKGMDGAYWDLELTGYVLTSNFERCKKVEMDFTFKEKNDEGGENHGI